MKTLAYNPKQEIMTAMTAMFISLAVIATAKAQETKAETAGNEYQMVLYRPIATETRPAIKMFTPTEREKSLPVEAWMSSNRYWGATETLEAEEPLTVENWMASTYFWGTTNLNEQPETENPLAIESWMNSNNYWGTAAEELEAEPALAVENWMNANSFWGVINASEVEETEAPLAVEQWMHCNAYWLGSKYCNEQMNELAEEEAPLNVENWMASNSYWGQDNNQQLASN